MTIICPTAFIIPDVCHCAIYHPNAEHKRGVTTGNLSPNQACIDAAFLRNLSPFFKFQRNNFI